MEGFPGDIKLKKEKKKCKRGLKYATFCVGRKEESENVHVSAHLCKKRHKKENPEINGVGYLQRTGWKGWVYTYELVLTFGTSLMFHILKINKNEKKKSNSQVQTELKLQMNSIILWFQVNNTTTLKG